MALQGVLVSHLLDSTLYQELTKYRALGEILYIAKAINMYNTLDHTLGNIFVGVTSIGNVGHFQILCNTIT